MTDPLDWNAARLEVVEIVLKGWTALDLQIQHNPHDKEKRMWLPQPISDAMKYARFYLIYEKHVSL